MIIGGYDTDDLTDRQHYYFNKLGRKTLIARMFLEHSVRKNFRLQKFDNYDGDCDFLLSEDKEMLLAKFGIDTTKIYN